MTRGIIREYVEAIRGRYLGVTRKEKGRILDEFNNVTSLHRKEAIRLLRCEGQVKVSRKRRRPRCYGSDVISALRVVWEVTDRLCSRGSGGIVERVFHHPARHFMVNTQLLSR